MAWSGTTDPVDLQRTIRRSWEELGAGTQWRRAAVSWYLTACACEAIAQNRESDVSLKESFKRDRVATLGSIRPQIEGWILKNRSQVLRVLRSMPECSWEGADLTAFEEPLFFERLIHLTLECLLVHAAAPPLLLAPVPELEVGAVLYRKRIVAVLFDWPLGFTHEFYPLWTDAYVYSQSRRLDESLYMLGAHVSWLDESCRLTRVIYYDRDADVMIETPLERALEPSAAMLLCQPMDIHRQMSEKLTKNKIFHINTYQGGAEIADDKWRCYEVWRKAKIATPLTCLLKRDLSSEAVRKMAGNCYRTMASSGAGWVIQPRHGTEGYAVYWIPPRDLPEVEDNVVRYWEEIAADDDAILRPRVGLVYLRDEERSDPRAFDIRYYVSFDGSGYRVESGYLMVAGDSSTPITSIARGGKIVRLAQLRWENLVFPESLEQGMPNENRLQEELQKAARMAASAVEQLGQLEFAGVDVKLDVAEGALLPSVLDANPRPAGLLHADLLGTESEAGVAPGLWSRFISIA